MTTIEEKNKLCLRSVVVKNFTTLWLNGDPSYKVAIPNNILTKPYDDQNQILEDALAKGSIKYDLYASDDVINQCIKFIKKDLHGRALVSRINKSMKQKELEPGTWLSRQLEHNKELDIVDARVKKVLSRETFRTLSDTKEVLWYHEGYDQPGGEDRINSLLEQLGGPHVKITIRREVIERIKIKTLTSRDKYDSDPLIRNVRVRNSV